MTIEDSLLKELQPLGRARREEEMVGIVVHILRQLESIARLVFMLSIVDAQASSLKPRIEQKIDINAQAEPYAMLPYLKVKCSEVKQWK